MFPSAAELVARFLRANDYTETLNAFIREAGLPSDTGSASGSKISIEQILQEKKTFDLSLNFEKLGVQDEHRGWLVLAPTKPSVLASIPTKSNILNVALVKCKLPSKSEPYEYYAATTADRRLHLFDPTVPSLPLIQSYTSFVDSPILDFVVFKSKFLLTASMSGRLLLYNTETDQVLDERKDQTKYIVKLAAWSENSSILLASAGWDSKVLLYRFDIDEEHPLLGQPIATINLSSIPETLSFIQSPETMKPIILLSRKDSTFLYYYSVPLPGENQIKLLGRQNLAPHSNAWISFTPSDVQLSPHDASLVAVATSSTPHMKLIVVRLLIPLESTDRDPDPDRDSVTPITQASQARANLLVQDREEAAMSINVSTMAPQSAYSTPRLVWRPDGSGIWVSSDDGVIRGFESTTGKQIVALEGHEPGSKIRCLWAGRVQKPSDNNTHASYGEECLLTGGFDKELISWGIP
ncbi:hypothetical protein CC80DRAFT_191943 [Byssothecium circinans]|uniref:LisH domain-containing protein n=1 Tax=Byssothecium circinans TaxID=147558 RepID=A0A6A5THU1_9PLEO|nr:hypothetical protein CC80DRAFT_191943 [Byssothecium circinans]